MSQTGGEDAQNKLRRSAVDNEIFGEHSMPEGADKSNKPKDDDGDGKVNDGTSKEKEASSCGSHSKPKKKKSKKVKKAALEVATKVAAYRRVQEKQARVLRIKLATHVVRMDTLRRELDKCDPYQLSKSAAIGAHKAERLKAAALIRQYELEKQALLPGIAQLVAGSARAGKSLLGFGRKAALPAATAATGGIIGGELGHRKGYASGDAKGYGRGSAEGGANATRNLFKGLMDLQQKGSKLPDTAFDGLGGRSGEQPGDFAKSMSRMYEE